MKSTLANPDIVNEISKARNTGAKIAMYPICTYLKVSLEILLEGICKIDLHMFLTKTKQMVYICKKFKGARDLLDDFTHRELLHRGLHGSKFRCKCFHYSKGILHQEKVSLNKSNLQRHSSTVRDI